MIMKHLSADRKGHASLARSMEHPFDMHRCIGELFEGLIKDFGEIPIPLGVDREKVKATFNKGALSVTLPKIEKTKIEWKRIKITSA